MVKPTHGVLIDQDGRSDILDMTVRAGIAAAFALLVVLAFFKNVNWDEFYFLSHVHAFADGRLDRPLQTFFVHGFTWLVDVPGHEMGQVLVARLIMVGCVAITAIGIYRVAEHLTGAAAARIAVFAFLTSGFVLPHAASFRADPIAAALLTAAFATIMTTQMKLVQSVFVAVLCALALLVTIKAALYVPAFLAALIWRWDNKGVVWRTGLAGVLTILFCGALYMWHASGIVAAPANETTTNMREAATTGLLEAGWFPRLAFIATWAVLSIPSIILMLFGLRPAGTVKNGLLLVLMAAPLLSVVIYRNAFPYFFPFAVPLVMIAVAFGAAYLARSAWLLRLVIVMAATGLFQAGLSFTEDQATQHETIAEVHRLFPEPVTYIDDSNMIASFPSVGPFMSSWGMKAYRNAGQPIFAGLIETHQPPLLIANKWTLMATMEQRDPRHLLPEDVSALQNSYVHYNGAIWLAGRVLKLGDTETQVSVPFAGRYRVTTNAPIRIDGVQFETGDIVTFDGPAQVTGALGTEVTFIWDSGVAPLDAALPTRQIYADFWTFWR